MNARSAPHRGHRVTFVPGDQQAETLPGETLLQCARRSGVRIAAVCGGRALCRSCAVRIQDGAAGLPSEQDRDSFTEQELAQGWRRACQVVPAGDGRVEISAHAGALPLRMHVAGEDLWVRPDPAVRTYRVTVPPASGAAPPTHDLRLMHALNASWPGIASRVDIAVQHHLANMLRADTTLMAAVRFGEIIAVAAPDTGPLTGLAVDLGTTNIGVLLVDLRSGKTLERCGVENSQVARGGDIITRMAYANASPEAAAELREMAIETINRAARSLCRARGLSADCIADIVIAGNTAMHHLLLGLPVDRLGRVPFVAAATGAMDVKTRDLRILAAPGAWVHLLPNIAGFVGGDHTAVLLATGADRETRNLVVLDIGTNTEISLLHQGRLSSLSCPSGPAFEGGHVRCGMRSAAGAIEMVEITADGVRIETIDDAAPAGICGSGVLDVTAQLYLSGVVDVSGRMTGPHPRVRTRHHRREFILAGNPGAPERDIVFTQDDVRAVQLAKSAIRSGIAILLENAGLAEADLDQVIIAGAFGNYIRISSAVAIGMLPALPPERFAQIGNAAAIGAKLALVSCPHRAEARSIANRSRYLELAGSARFSREFMLRLRFPPRELTREVLQNADS